MKKPADARAAAVRQLVRIEEAGAFVGLMDDDLDARDERLVTEYVAGITRWRRWLDFVLSQFYRGTYAEIDPRLRQILRIGLYDLTMLSTPSHAAVHEAVELTKRDVGTGAGRLTNGVLRSVQRSLDRLPEPDTGSLVRDLAIRQSHPTWMVRRWLDRFGEAETRALLHHNNARPTYGVRVNTLRQPRTAFIEALKDVGGEGVASPYLDDFVRMERLQPIVRAGWLAEGRCAVQDEAAGLVVRLLDPQPGETVFDLCAAPGGKALYAATRMRNEGCIYAFDVHASRLGLLDRAAEAHGITIVTTEPADARALPTRTPVPQADRVLLDAPCSGLGVLAKRADLRWRITPDDIAKLAVLQDELLDAAAALVRPGGLLGYSTCTLAPEENEQRVAAFLDRHPAFDVESAEGLVPDAMVTEAGYYAALPQRHGTDGAFGVRLRRHA